MTGSILRVSMLISLDYKNKLLRLKIKEIFFIAFRFSKYLNKDWIRFVQNNKIK